MPLIFYASSFEHKIIHERLGILTVRQFGLPLVSLGIDGIHLELLIVVLLDSKMMWSELQEVPTS